MEHIDMTTHEIDANTPALSQPEAIALDLGPLEAVEVWQQPALLPAPAPARLPRRAPRHNDRLRQVGLVGIAQARAVLAEAARRAHESAGSRAA